MNLGDDDLNPLKVLGQGTFGRVFLCRSRSNKQLVCVKRIIVQNPKVQMKMICEEVYIISQLKHPRIIQFLRSFVHAGTVNIAMEFACGGTLRDIIDNNPANVPIGKDRLLKYFCDILMGLEYLHIRHVIHRDLKPENILLDENDRVKIADFGISFIHSSKPEKLNAYGTPYYLAPEILKGARCDFKADIWSLGCVLYEMCLGVNPFKFAVNIEELRTILLRNRSSFYNCAKVATIYGPIWSRLCESMLTYEPSRRIALPDILCIDSMITVPFYKLYFEYEYS